MEEKGKDDSVGVSLLGASPALRDAGWHVVCFASFF
jgi:hypothetical protein